MRFTAEQSARGILATIDRGDWSLAVSRLVAVSDALRPKVQAIVERSLGADERHVWDIYVARSPALKPATKSNATRG